MHINGKILERDLKIGIISIFVLLLILHLLDMRQNTETVLDVVHEPYVAQVLVSVPPNVKKISCPSPFGEDDIYKIVSKEESLGEYFVPEDLELVSNDISRNANICLKSIALDNLERMFLDASLAGYELEVTSAFRSYSYQGFLFNMYFARDGEDARRYSAEPGHSEHQLGTTVDITAKGLPSTYHFFHTTEEGKWVLDHAHEYGFVMSYPEGGEDVTGYMFEPWHYRYVGVDIAKSVYESNTTLYEYLFEKKEIIDPEIVVDNF